MFRRVLTLLAVAVALFGAGRAEAQRRVRIQIESQPPGATVYLDSEDSAPLGVTPMDRAIVRSGQHTLIFKKDNYQTTKLNVNVRRWRETFRAVLDPLSKLIVTPVNAGAQGATLVIDGEQKGQLPWTGTLKPGRHFVQVRKEGFQDYSQWHQLDAGQTTVPVMLEEDQPETGSVLVAGGRPGATIFLDGQPAGVTPTVIEDVSAGEHRLEVRSEGMKPFEKTIRVEVGKRLSVTPEFGPQRGPEGTLRVVTQPRGATITIDGDVVGESPVTKEGLAVGEHLVEAEAEGYAPKQKQVEVEAGQQGIVSIQLEQDAGPGRIVVNADVDGATVYIDGEEKGAPPVVVEDAEPGTHAVLIKAPGHRDFRDTCEVGRSQNCEISAEMDVQSTPVRVEANVQGAQFYVDGELMGPVPYEGPVPAGSRRIEVRAPGYQTHVEQVMIEPAEQIRVFNVALTEEGAKSPEELANARQRRLQATREAASYSAAPLPQDMTVIDVGLGWPWIARARLGVGILEWLEAGFAMRTFGRLTEFEGRAKAGWRPIKQLALGGQFRLGGGIGPSRAPSFTEDSLSEPGGPFENDPPGSHPTNSFFMAIEALGTLHFSQAGAFTLWLALDVTSDRWDWAGENNNVLHTIIDAPDGATNMELAELAQASRDRQSLARLRLGGSLEILINNDWNVWALLEGIVAGQARRVYGDIFGGNNGEFKLYMAAGVTYKFGIARQQGVTFEP